MTNYKLVLLWVVSLSFEVYMAGFEVVWVNRNVTDNFRVGEHGCTNDTSVCTSVSAICQDDGSCLCNKSSPNFRNPIIEASHGRYVYGSTYGCIRNSESLIGVGTTACPFQPFQVLPYSHNHPATTFSQNDQLLSCSVRKILVKFPDNATEIELQWLDESYLNTSVSGNNLFFKVGKLTCIFWKRSVPALQGTIITFYLSCELSFQFFLGTCVRAKILGRWPAGTLNFPTTTEPTVSSAKIKSSSSTASTPRVEIITSAKLTVRVGSDEKSSDSTNKIFIALFSICIVVIVVLGIIVGYRWKDRQRIRSKNLQFRGRKCSTNINFRIAKFEGKGKRNTGETSVYDEVVDSEINNDGMNKDSFPSAGQKNNTERFSEREYEELSNYEPLRRNPLQGENDDHNYQSLTTSQK